MAPRSIDRRNVLSLACLALCAGLIGCLPPLKPARTPMPALNLATTTGPTTGTTAPADAEPAEGDAETPQGMSPCALVLLPGAFNQPKDFARHTFDDILHQRHPGMRIVAADAHMGYYRKRSVIDRLSEDVVGPLRQDGYRVWIAGISLGGVGTLLYGKLRQGDPELAAEGLVTIAPYLGEDELIAEIKAAGGPLKWQAPSFETPPKGRKNVGYELWPWLASWHQQRIANPDNTPHIVLAYGLKDDFAPAGEIMATLLDEDKIFTHPAGHDWDAWVPLWQDIVEAGTFDDCGV